MPVRAQADEDDVPGPFVEADWIDCEAAAGWRPDKRETERAGDERRRKEEREGRGAYVRSRWKRD